MLRTPQRTYSPEAIEQWFDRLQVPWEEGFSDPELRLGRSLYRSGEIRGLELLPEMAVVSAREGKTEIYSVLEWKSGALTVRSSIEKPEVGRALAVAGLYEIEELVLDEVNTLNAPASGPAPVPAENGSPRPEEARLPMRREAQPPAERPSRELRVRLWPSEAGVHLDAAWYGPEGRDAPAFARGRLTMREREDLIRLTTRARHNGFVFRSGPRDYLLRDFGRLPAFVREEVGRWRKAFRTEVDPRLENLAAGVREAKAVFEASQTDGQLHARWRFRVDQSLLNDAEALGVIRARGRTILVPSQGLVRVSDEVAEVLREWAPLLGEGTRAVLPPYMIFSIFGHESIRIREADALKAWRQRLHEGAAGPAAEFPAFLRPYQARGAAWIANLLELGCHALLADEMGLGKTVQVLSVLDHLRARDRELAMQPVLIVAPASVVPVWVAEIERFFPAWKPRVVSADRLPRAEDAQAGAGSGTIWISSYSQLRRNKAAMAETNFAVSILDEAQFIKNPDAKVTHACFAINARHRIALTGTPLENRQLDLWTLFRYLMPGLLGSRLRTEEALRDDPAGYTEQLRRQIAPFVLRRTKNEVASELPEKMEHVLVCPLSPSQRREYVRLTRKAHHDFQGASSIGEALRERSITFLSLLTRLRQACCDAELLPWVGPMSEPGGKIACLLTRLSDVVASGRKAVVFSQFTTFLALVRARVATAYPEVPLLELTGSTSDRAAPVRRFQEDPGPAVMLVSLRAGGTGITLHAAEYVFLMDPWWNPAVEAQAIDRVHRIGQDRPVSVYRLVTRGTIEERVQRLKDEKRDLFDHLVGRLREGAMPADAFGSLSALIDLEERPDDEAGEELS